MINCSLHECILLIVVAVVDMLLLAESNQVAVTARILLAGHSLVAVLHILTAVAEVDIQVAVAAVHIQVAVAEVHIQVAVAEVHIQVAAAEVDIQVAVAAVRILAVEGSSVHTAVAVEEAPHSHGCMSDNRTVQRLEVDHAILSCPEKRRKEYKYKIQMGPHSPGDHSHHHHHHQNGIEEIVQYIVILSKERKSRSVTVGTVPMCCLSFFIASRAS